MNIITRVKLDKLHIFLVIIIVTSLAFNISFYFSFRSLETDLKIATSDDTIQGETIDGSSTSDKIAEAEDNLRMTFTVESGGTFSKIFSDAGIAPNDINQIIQAIAKVHSVSKLHVGNKVEIKFLAESDINKLKEIDDYYSRVEMVRFITDEKILEVYFDKDMKEFTTKVIEIPIQHNEVVFHGEINDSLYLSATKAGASPSIIKQFINLFSYDVDFQRDIKQGDKFELFYDYYTNQTGQKVKESAIKYASITVSGKQYKIYRFEHNDIVDYYTEKGESIKKTLLKTPISGAKITSGYGMRRHPILGFSRMHKGLDYGAPRGTPVFAAGDGVVQFIKTDNGYGKYIKIKHSTKYSTLYAHLDRLAPSIKKGSRVNQGQTIGFVGTTGLANGPHLHYEVHDRDRQINPSKISFAKNLPLSGQTLTEFKIHLKNISEKINVLKSGGK